MGTLIIKALIARYTAQRDEALATLSLYLNNPSITPDHSGIIDEIDCLLQKLSAAESLMLTLEQNIRLENRPEATSIPEESNE
jgi:ACT domain-containing protein